MLFSTRATTSNGAAGSSIDARSSAPVAPATSASASVPLSSRPPSYGSTSTRSPNGADPGPDAAADSPPNPTTKCPGNATPYTGAPARRATSSHTTDSRIGSPRRRRTTSCSNDDSSRW